jgi:hypothetical protein
MAARSPRLGARRQEQSRGPLALHHRTALLGEQHDRPIFARETDPARGDAAAHELQQPAFGVGPEVAERLERGQPLALEPGVGVAVHELDSRL